MELRQKLQNALNVPKYDDFVSLFDVPTEVPLQILGIRKVETEYGPNYAVYTDKCKVYANKKLRESIKSVQKNLMATYDSDVAADEGMLVPLQDFTFVTLKSRSFEDIEYVPIKILTYPKRKAPELHSHFIKYPGSYEPLPDKLIKGDYSVIGYDEEGYLLVYNGDRQWVTGPKCEDLKDGKKLEEITTPFIAHF